MAIKIGINGFGRMGRLIMRVAWDWPEVEFIQINDPKGNAEVFAHLLNFDSIHGKWAFQAMTSQSGMTINDSDIKLTQNALINDTDWSLCDVVIEASGVMRHKDKLQAYLDQGVKKILVTAPLKIEEFSTNMLNVVMGINHYLYDEKKHNIITAASCTTNCLAPVIKVLQDNVGIKHGSITTIHNITNTQMILDAPHKDLRRARACGTNLIPTTTGSAKAITDIFPELKGKLNGHAIRVPVINASITDCVFELQSKRTAKQINQLMANAANAELKGILGYEELPLVSIDYKTDPRSCIVDALSTMVINDTQLKMYLWYDNEWGYANRAAELMKLISLSIVSSH